MYLMHIGKANTCLLMMEREKETTAELGREDENYLFGLGFRKITCLALRLLLQHVIALREEV